MNTRDINENTNKIYLVKYNEIHQMHELNITKNTTYNLCTFEDVNKARKFLNASCNSIVNPLISNGDFRKILETDDNYEQKESSGAIIFMKKTIKLVGSKILKQSQSKLFIFTIEEINFIRKS